MFWLLLHFSVGVWLRKFFIVFNRNFIMFFHKFFSYFIAIKGKFMFLCLCSDSFSLFHPICQLTVSTPSSGGFSSFSIYLSLTGTWIIRKANWKHGKAPAKGQKGTNERTVRQQWKNDKELRKGPQGNNEGNSERTISQQWKDDKELRKGPQGNNEGNSERTIRHQRTDPRGPQGANREHDKESTKESRAPANWPARDLLNSVLESFYVISITFSNKIPFFEHWTDYWVHFGTFGGGGRGGPWENQAKRNNMGRVVAPTQSENMGAVWHSAHV